MVFVIVFNARLYVHLPRLGSRRRSKTTSKPRLLSLKMSQSQNLSRILMAIFLHESGLAACLLDFPCVCTSAPCGHWDCKNRPAPFPGQMSYKVTKPGLVLFYILACFNCIVAY